MKEFNLVENLKQPCLTGRLTGFNLLCAVSVCVSQRVCYVSMEGGVHHEGEIKKKCNAIKSDCAEAYVCVYTEVCL